MSLDVDKTGRILTVTMNRPEALNALDPETESRMREVFDDFREDDGLWAAILTGAGEKAFCAGADIKKTIASVLDESAWVQRKSHLGGRDVYHALENQTKPILSAVNGYALGGGLELALCCDIRIASETASLGLPEVSLGIMPGAGGTQRLSRVVGMARALDLVLTGERIDARAALSIGLVTRVVPPGELMKTARALAENICRKAPLSVRFAKEAVRRGAEMNLADGLAFENTLFTLLRGTQDAKEGTSAFAEKRKPEFRGE
ncbi:MAG: enoyl-CoA hydratase-related protein [Nitrospinota bacterium]|jgi:enoyl-CoA hydratase/carnithine racemase|nr:enoyl-CoA hydratase-related protein [Nitrospinota bacterium]MDP6618961.1 enoyl-CoA hydratase-related protein [Nitrospinota bacterium]HJM44226.1 enoyl-CoA hydratase-related protein [Nitrospinota bacterium]